MNMLFLQKKQTSKSSSIVQFIVDNKQENSNIFSYFALNLLEGNVTLNKHNNIPIHLQ